MAKKKSRRLGLPAALCLIWYMSAHLRQTAAKIIIKLIGSA